MTDRTVCQPTTRVGDDRLGGFTPPLPVIEQGRPAMQRDEHAPAPRAQPDETTARETTARETMARETMARQTMARQTPDLDVMNNEPSEASPNEQPEVAANVKPAESSASTPPSDDAPTASPAETTTSNDAGSPTAADAASGDTAWGDGPVAESPAAGDESQADALASTGDGGQGSATAAPPQRPRGPIQVGSRREKSDRTPARPKPQVAGADKPMQVDLSPPRQGPVPTPSVRDPLSPDLEEQFAAAMGDASLDEILAGGDRQRAAGGDRIGVASSQSARRADPR